MHDDILTSREDLRRTAIARREAMTATAREALTARLEVHLAKVLDALQPQCLAFCWPFRGEPDLRHFMGRWLAANPSRQAALPVVIDRHRAMVFRAWAPATRLVPDRHGIPYPPTGPELRPQVVLVPLNAFDAAGYRIGYGGGYFDRTLAETEMVAVGVGFEIGRVSNALPQAHDRPMQWIVTEAGAGATGDAVRRETSDSSG